MFQYIEKREQIIVERAEYEESLKDPDRLLKLGRDTGRLLREEKLQMRIKKDLPKVTEWLYKKIAAWVEEYEMNFLYRGLRYTETTDQADRAYVEKKEAEKAAKDKKKREERQHEMTWGSTPRRTLPKEKPKVSRTGYKRLPKETDANNVCSLSRQLPACAAGEDVQGSNIQKRLSLGSTLQSPRSEGSA